VDSAVAVGSAGVGSEVGVVIPSSAGAVAVAVAMINVGSPSPAGPAHPPNSKTNNHAAQSLRRMVVMTPLYI